MEVEYNVKFIFKNEINKTEEKLKQIVNEKLANIILKLENEKQGFNNL